VRQRDIDAVRIVALGVAAGRIAAVVGYSGDAGPGGEERQGLAWNYGA